MGQEIYEENPFFKNWRELITPQKLEIDKETYTPYFGKFICQPFERGFATTIGNSLRRVLLSSIRGAAITAVKIDNALHEFTTINGVHEDVAEIILNLKQVRIKLLVPNAVTVVIEKTGPGSIVAGDIMCGNHIEVMNPEQPICTLTSHVSFRAELEVRWGKGYVPAEQNKREDHPVDMIAIDAAFSPIKRIQYIVNQARVGQQTDYDRLTLEIETDGSIRPDDALAYSAKILKEQMSIFINFNEEEVEPPEGGDGLSDPVYDKFLDKNVEDLELSVRSANCLKNAKIKYIGELVQKTDAEMLKTKNFGRKSLNEIKALLADHNFSLGTDIGGWLPPGGKNDSDEEDFE